MNKTIYINENQLKLIKESENKEKMLFYTFFYKIKSFLKELLKDPINAKVDKELKLEGISKNDLIKKLLNYSVIEKIQKIEDDDGSARYYLQYKVHRNRFKNKLYKIYIDFFEKNTNENIDIIKEDGEGATSCAGVGGDMGAFGSSGEYVTPMFSIVKRSFFGSNKGKKQRKNDKYRRRKRNLE